MTSQQPLFWVRIRSDGGFEGPIHDSALEEVRKRSGAWTPLYTAPPPVAAGVPMDLTCDACKGSGEGGNYHVTGTMSDFVDGPCHTCHGTGSAPSVPAPADAVAGRDPVPFHPSASHIPPDWRDGWNAALKAVGAAIAAEKGGA